jgi:hypothetical protein
MDHDPGAGSGNDTLSLLRSMLNNKEVRVIAKSAERTLTEAVAWIFEFHRVCRKRNNYQSSVQSVTPCRLCQRCHPG